MAPVHKTRGRNTTRRPAPVELMGTSTEKLVSAFTRTPNQGTSTKQFECPLCVDVFKKFSQLQWHLLSMHPRREMIMNLIMERYGILVSKFGSVSLCVFKPTFCNALYFPGNMCRNATKCNIRFSTSARALHMLCRRSWKNATGVDRDGNDNAHVQSSSSAQPQSRFCSSN